MTIITEEASGKVPFAGRLSLDITALLLPPPRDP
jgi:hypothetical protein